MPLISSFLLSGFNGSTIAVFLLESLTVRTIHSLIVISSESEIKPTVPFFKPWFKPIGIVNSLLTSSISAEIELVNNELTIPIGLNQGLKKGTVGFISDSEDITMSEWIVLTVSDSRRNTAIVEPLNPLNKKEEIKGKIIKFMD